VKLRWAAVLLRARADQRRRWRATVVAGILVGVALGAATSAAAGARRTASAYDALVASTDAADVVVGPSCVDGESEEECDRQVPARVRALHAVLRSQPMVADIARVSSTIVPVTDLDGEILQPDQDGCFSGSGGLTVDASVDGRAGTTMLRYRLAEGRVADAAEPGEAVLSYHTARDHGIHAGDRIRAYFDAVDCSEATEWGAPTELTVTGIAVSAGEIRPESGEYLQSLRVHPSLVRDETQALAVRLASGTTVDDLLAAGLPLQDYVRFDEFEADVEQGLTRDAAALWLVAALGALASMLVVAPALVRFATSTAGDDKTALALGWTRRERLASGALRGAFVGAVAGVIVAALVVVTSRGTPIGDGRIIGPRHQIDVDEPAMALGITVALAVSIAVVAMVTGRVSARRSGAPTAPSTASRLLQFSSGRPVLNTGVRIAFDPRPRTAAWTSVVSMVLGIATVAGVLVYTASAQQLRETPALIGYTWDDFLYTGDVPGRALARTAATWPEIERVGHLTVFLPPLVLGDGERVVESTTLAFGTEPGMIEPTAISGRAPSAPDEILLNPLLASELSVNVGDVVPATFGEGSADFEIVGLGPVPTLGSAFARGSAITAEALAILIPPEHLEPEPHFVLLDRHQGANEASLRGKLEGEGVAFEEAALDADIEVNQTIGLDTTRSESAPTLLAFLMLITTTAVLAFTVTTLIRGRSHELSVMRAIGFTRTQTRGAYAVAGLSLVIFVCATAVVAGAIVGSQLWRSYAHDLGVVARVHVPVLEMLVLVTSGSLVAISMAIIAAHSQLRRSIAAILRAE
jgi:hypothetical protein